MPQFPVMPIVPDVGQSCMSHPQQKPHRSRQDYSTPRDFLLSVLKRPYAHIAPWVGRAWSESRKGAHVLMLLPAGVGSNWWRDFVHEKARVLLLNGRLTFGGETAPYPKDLVLLEYGPKVYPGYTVWNWR